MPAPSATSVMFELLVELQLTTEELYRTFAAQLPAEEEFWHERAATVHRLAVWMRVVQVEMQEGAIEYNAQRFSRRAVRLALQQAELLLQEAREHPVDHARAIEMALTLENSPVKQHCHEVVLSCSTIAQQVRKTLSQLMRTHRAHFQQEAISA